MSPGMMSSLHFFIVAVGVKNLYEVIKMKKEEDMDFLRLFFRMAIIVGAVMFSISYLRVRPYLG